MGKKITGAVLAGVAAVSLVGSAPAHAANVNGVCDQYETCFYEGYNLTNPIRDTTASQYTYFSQWDFLGTSKTLLGNVHSVTNYYEPLCYTVRLFSAEDFQGYTSDVLCGFSAVDLDYWASFNIY